MSEIGKEILPRQPLTEVVPAESYPSSRLRKVAAYAVAGVVGLTASLVTGYGMDVMVTSATDPNDDPSITELKDRVPCKDRPAMVSYRHGTGMDTSGYTASVTAETVEKLNACVTALHYGKTNRPKMNAIATGEYIRSLGLKEKMVLVLAYVSGGGVGVAEEVEELQKNYGDVLTIAGVGLEAVPDNVNDIKKDSGRFFVNNYGLPYGKTAVLLNNIKGQIDENADFSKQKTRDDIIINTNATRVELTQSMLKGIKEEFQGVDDPEVLRNSDGTMPLFEYQCASTDDTVDCESARAKIEQKLKVPVPMNMIESDVPFMHDKKWIHTVYPVVYERDYRALLEKIKNHTPSWYKHD